MQRDRAENYLCSKICLLGGGQMAEAILNALSQKKVQKMNSVFVYDISKVKRSAT